MRNSDHKGNQPTRNRKPSITYGQADKPILTIAFEIEGAVRKGKRRPLPLFNDEKKMNDRTRVENKDCMIAMRKMKDKEFDLAICDPPYGAGDNFNFRKEAYVNQRPDPDYFFHLLRVSKQQIIWGGNYFTADLPENRCWISWYKGQPIDSFSDFELAWTSFDQTSRAVKLESYGFNHADKKHTGNSTIHPTQKPVALYKWLLKNYAKEGDKILDTHLGSGSSRIAAFDMGFEFWGYELDKDYFDAQEKRFAQHKAQLKLFPVGI